MGRADTAAGVTVTKVPGIGDDAAIGIVRTGAIKAYCFTNRTTVRTTSISCRRYIGDRRDGGRTAGAIGVAGIIGDRQGHGECSVCGIGVRRADTAAGAAVTKVPGVAGDAAIAVA